MHYVHYWELNPNADAVSTIETFSLSVTAD